MAGRNKGKKVSVDAEETVEEQPGFTSSVIRAMRDPEFIKEITNILKDPSVILGLSNILKPIIEDEVRTVVSQLGKKIEGDLKGTLTSINDKIEGLELEVATSLSKNKKDIADIQINLGSISDKMRSLDRSFRGCNLLVFGLPDPPVDTEGVSIQDKYIKTFHQILNEANFEGVSQSDFLGSTRVTSPSKNNFIIFRLSSPEKKNQIFSQRTKLKGLTHRIFINEDLTREDAAIFKRARSEQKNGKLSSVWTRDGKVWGKATDSGKPFVIDV
jgi:hypothetical protein